MKQLNFSLSRSFSAFLPALLFAAVLAGCAGPVERPGPAPGAIADEEVELSLPQPPEPETVEETEKEAPVVDNQPLAPSENRVYFDFDSAVLDETARALLGGYADYLGQNSRILRLEGHTDERGTREYNLALGQSRAEAVLDYLVLQGISRSRLRAASYGEERPADAGRSEQSWQQNRRVEIIFN